MRILRIALFISTISTFSCQSQTTAQKPSPIVGGPCEGCEAIYEYGDRKLTGIDTLPDFELNQPQLKISGTVYQKDGRTPAKDVIVYIYHTNREGIYPNKGNEKGWGRRHGYIRGWIKTDDSGAYTFFTFRPAAYPGRSEPEHIHVTVLEPQKNPYYLDDFLFEDDPLLSADHRTSGRNRGGPGIVQTQPMGDLMVIHRNLILGFNIPDYD